MPPLPQIVRFDIFELDLRAGELRKGGLRIRLQQQPLFIMQALLERPGDVVSREELQKKIWPADTFVDFDHGVHAAVNRLRAALSDSAGAPRYIETVGRRGYRFIGRLDKYEGLVPVSPDPQADSSEQFRKPFWKSRAGVLASFAIAIALGTFLVTYRLKDRLLGNLTPRPQFRSLAVLPLQDLTPDPQPEYFADAMTEELITEISKLRDLKVISHTSTMQYKGTRESLPQIASELHVDAVVEGAVQLSGNRVRVDAQLVDARTDQHIWAETYDRDMKDVLLLESEVARDVARQIDLELSPQQKQHLATGTRAVNPDAYQDYLLGRYYWNKRTANGLDLAGKYFQQAIHKDPNYAPAYSGLADYFAFLTLIGGPEILSPREAMTQARQAAEKGLQLDDSLADTHASMGHILHNYDWDFRGAEREFQRAIELNPNHALVHHWYSHYLMEVGRQEQSIAEAKRAQELDPLSPSINNGLARQYYLARKYDQAIAQCQLGLRIDSTYLPARIQLALAYEQKGMIAQAISELEQARKIGSLPVVHALLAHAYATAGRRKDALSELNVLSAENRHQYVSPSYLAIVYIALGDRDRAFAYLQKSCDERSEHILYLGVEPLVDPLRGDPRFDALLKRVGLKP
jgi:TolB-like protein/DNA-binding winged helix-turn-helix (wHTH) protein